MKWHFLWHNILHRCLLFTVSNLNRNLFLPQFLVFCYCCCCCCCCFWRSRKETRPSMKKVMAVCARETSYTITEKGWSLKTTSITNPDLWRSNPDLWRFCDDFTVTNPGCIVTNPSQIRGYFVTYPGCTKESQYPHVVTRKTEKRQKTTKKRQKTTSSGCLFQQIPTDGDGELLPF